MSSHYLLTSMVSAKMSSLFLNESPLYRTVISLLLLSRFFLWLWLLKVLLEHVSLWIWVFFLPKVRWASWMCRFMCLIKVWLVGHSFLKILLHSFLSILSLWNFHYLMFCYCWCLTDLIGSLHFGSFLCLYVPQTG